MFCSCLTMKKYEYVACNEIPQEAINIAIIDHNKGLKRQKDAYRTGRHAHPGGLAHASLWR